VGAALIVCWSVADVHEAAAQVIVGATAGVSIQSEGARDEPYLYPPFGGTSFSTVVFVDVTASPTVTVGGEVSLAANISGSQFQRTSVGIYSFVSDHHDSIFSGVVKVNTPKSNPVYAAMAAGAGLAHRDTNRTGTVTSNFPPVTTPATQNVSDVVFAFNWGADGVFAASHRVAIMVLFRAYYLIDDDRLADGVVQRGVSSLIFRYGVGARVRL